MGICCTGGLSSLIICPIGIAEYATVANISLFHYCLCFSGENLDCASCPGPPVVGSLCGASFEDCLEIIVGKEY